MFTWDRRNRGLGDSHARCDYTRRYADLGCGGDGGSHLVEQLPDSLRHVRTAIEQAAPHGRTGGGRKDKGSLAILPDAVASVENGLHKRFNALCDRYRGLAKSNHVSHLGTLVQATLCGGLPR